MKTLWRAVFVTTLFIVAVTLLTTEKVAYIWTLRAIAAPDVPMPTGYAALTVLLVSPYLLAFFQGLWNVSFLTRCTDTRLPPVYNILLGLLTSVLEGACVTWFTTMAASVLPVFVVLPAVASVLSFSAISPVLSSPHGRSIGVTWTAFVKVPAESFCSKVRQYMAAVALFGPVVAAAILYLSDTLPWMHCSVFALTMTLLSIMWSPGVQYRTISVNGEVSLNCRRLSVLYSFIKVFSVCFFIRLDVALYAKAGEKALDIAGDFFKHFRDVGRKSLLIPLLLNVSASVFSQGFAYLSLAFCQPLFGVLLPSVLSTVASVVLCIGYLGPYVYHVQELTHFGHVFPLIMTASVLAATWGLAYVLRTFDAVHKPRYLFMPYEDVLTDYGWSPGFSDQRRLLTFCAEGADLESVLRQPTRVKKSRVYVCTTMYREADYEMERLLLSLQRLPSGESLQNVYLEAHIFMDNGVKDTRLGDFAGQLLGLLVSHFGMNPEEARCLLTPYGMQLTCFLPGGMPLFVHLKDPAKVKAKKRWSQCMYINYIMNFRKVMWEQDAGNYGQFLRGSDSKIYFISDSSPDKTTAATVNPKNTHSGTVAPRAAPNSTVTSDVDATASVAHSTRKISNVGYPTFSDFTDGFEVNMHDGVDNQGCVSVGSSTSPNLSDDGVERRSRGLTVSKTSLCNLLNEKEFGKIQTDNPAILPNSGVFYDNVEFKSASELHLQRS